MEGRHSCAIIRWVASRPIELECLRDIGWLEWDPIGLQRGEGNWRTSTAADEYDQYLLNAARALRRGEPNESLVDYLCFVETVYMGLSPKPTTRARAVATIAAICEFVNDRT